MTQMLSKYIEIPISETYESFNLDKSIRQFAERSNSDETKRTYKKYLEEFFAFAGITEGFQAVKVNSQSIIDWREAMKGHGAKANTVRTKLAAVRSFYETLKHHGFIENNPASVILVPPPKVGNNPKGRALTPSQVRLLLELPKRETIIGSRDYALMLLMLRTFMRVTEAISIREDDFFYHQNSWFVKIKIKGGEEKDVPIPSEVKQAITDYHFLERDRRKLVKIKEKESKFVFMPAMEKITRHGAMANIHLTARHVWYIVRKYGDNLFASDMLKIANQNRDLNMRQIRAMFRLTPHDFRRTAITRALDMGETYRRVMNASRHKSITSIERYDMHRKASEENSILTLNYQD